ncbi:MAG TPA: hypothetical protein VJX16_12025 [Terriglobales bacterium]|nr:hypothetical protein [Terriglobales bacterium]
MMKLRTFGKRFARKLFTSLILLACFSEGALPAGRVTGSVRNQSRGEPAAADEVILIRLDRAIEAEARAKTDAQGTFALRVRYPDKPYLVRVIHQGVSYDQQASMGQALSIEVFDAARRVRGVSGSIEILRFVTNGSLLHVSDLVEVKNESTPPRTKAGARTFEVFLPANGRLDSVLAAGPGETGLVISAAPVRGEPGHYTLNLNFPLRPGATKFAFNYDVPYDGHAAFQTRHAYPLRQLAIMIPLTMKFSSRQPTFQLLSTGNAGYQVQTAYQLSAGEGPSFEVSGTGTLPALGEQAKFQAPSQSPTLPNPIVSAAGRSALPLLAIVDSRPKQTQTPAQSLVLDGVTSILLAACALRVWQLRRGRKFSAARGITPGALPSGTLQGGEDVKKSATTS